MNFDFVESTLEDVYEQSAEQTAASIGDESIASATSLNKTENNINDGEASDAESLITISSDESNYDDAYKQAVEYFNVTLNPKKNHLKNGN